MMKKNKFLIVLLILVGLLAVVFMIFKFNNQNTLSDNNENKFPGNDQESIDQFNKMLEERSKKQ